MCGRQLWLGWLCVALTVSSARAQVNQSNTKKVDYCRILNCFDKHIACNNSGNFHANCPADALLVNMSANKEIILKLYNVLRDGVASGGARDFYYAVRMAQMQWSEELAYLAELNVKVCQHKRDRCRSTRTFPNAGQNNAFFIWRDNITKYSDEDLIIKVINQWLSEIKYSDMFILRKYPKVEPRPLQHHFAMAVNEKNTHIGCAGVRFYQNDYNRFVFTCNFATRNFQGTRVYNYLDEPKNIGSGCKKKLSTNYRHLCSIAEVYLYTRIYDNRPKL